MSRDRIIFTLFIIPCLLVAQNIDEAVRLFNSFQFDHSQKIFSDVITNKDNPRIAEAYYYLGRLTTSPDSALFYYNTVIENYPQSRYTDLSYLEIAKNNIARENYKNAITTLNELLEKFPDTSIEDEVLFWLGVSHISIDQKELGVGFLKKLKSNFPKSIWSERTVNIISTGEVNNEYFTIQVGSYRNKPNAQKLVEDLKNKGFNGKIIEALVIGNTYYRVWVGQFNTVEAAKAFSLILDSLGIKGNVVKGY